jgi:hypothetical protein
MSHQSNVEQTTASTAEQSILPDQDLESVAGGQSIISYIPDVLLPPIIICPPPPVLDPSVVLE